MHRPLKPFPITEQPESTHRPTRRGFSRRATWFIVAGVMLALSIGSILFWLTHYTSKTTPLVQNIHTESQASTPPVAGTTQLYTSNGADLKLSFAYPTDWSAVPPSDHNATDQPVTLTSPITSISVTNNTTVNGRIVMTIRPGSAPISELSSGSALVAQNSVQFAYSKPTASQHQYPYLTFIHLAGGQDSTGVFDEVIITGITQFTKGTSLTADSLGQLDPIISARFYQCSNSTCDGAGATSLSITNAMWQNSTLFQQIQTIFSSLQLN